MYFVTQDVVSYFRAFAKNLKVKASAFVVRITLMSGQSTNAKRSNMDDVNLKNLAKKAPKSGESLIGGKNSRRPLDVDTYVGIRLKACRLKCGLTQEQVAEKLGITFQQIQKYEKGINRVSAGRLYEIAAALNVQVSYFYDGFDEE